LYEYDDTYSFHQVIVDTDGNDTISVANSERNNVIDLRGGYFSSIAPSYIGWYYESCNDSNNEPIDGCEHLGRSHNSLTIADDSVIENATGGNGDDTLVANSVPNMLDGGDGIDTAMFAGNKADYTIEIVNSYTVVVHSVADSNDIDNLIDMEFIKFDDETIALNQAPIITDVTADQSINEGDTVTLNVTATDTDDDNLTYRWVVDGATVTLTGETTNTITFTAPNVTSDTALTVQVFVTDGFDEVSSETRKVTVKNVESSTTTATTEARSAEKSSGGSFGWLMILLSSSLVLLRKKQLIK